MSFACRVFGDGLFWEVNGERIITFSPNDPVDTGHTCSGELCGFDCFIISGILNDIRNRGNNSYCYSTLTITPGKLDNETSEVTPCMTLNSANLLMNVSCTTSGATNTEPKSLPFQIAGMLYYYYYILKCIDLV